MDCGLFRELPYLFGCFDQLGFTVLQIKVLTIYVKDFRVEIQIHHEIAILAFVS